MQTNVETNDAGERPAERMPPGPATTRLGALYAALGCAGPDEAGLRVSWLVAFCHGACCTATLALALPHVLALCMHLPDWAVAALAWLQLVLTAPPVALAGFLAGMLTGEGFDPYDAGASWHHVYWATLVLYVAVLLCAGIRLIAARQTIEGLSCFVAAAFYCTFAAWLTMADIGLG